MGYEFFIARRYLLSKRKIQFVSIISFISVVGITVGVAALLVALSVFNGFSGVVTSLLIGFDPHLKITQRGGLSAETMQSVESILESDGRVLAYSPLIEGKGMIVSAGASRVSYVRAVEEERAARATGVADRIIFGKFALDESAETAGMVVGFTLADRLGVVVGDEVSVFSPHALTAAMTPFTPVVAMKFRITGIFESHNKDYDANYSYISLARGRQMFRMTDRVSAMDVRLTNIDHAERAKYQWRERLGEGVEIATWYDLHRDLYSVMKIERWVAYIILSLIIVVASFNMLGSLTMSVIEKRRDIGVLKSMGATGGGLVRIFMVEGIIIGLIGTAAGIVLGLFLLYLQIRYHLFPLDTTVFIIPALPVEIHLVDFVAVASASLLLSALASYYPARRAASLVPAEALRWE